jgi:hypothetical protein
MRPAFPSLARHPLSPLEFCGRNAESVKALFAFLVFFVAKAVFLFPRFW